MTGWSLSFLPCGRTLGRPPLDIAAVDVARDDGVGGVVSIRGARARGARDRLTGVARLGGRGVAHAMRLGRRRLTSWRPIL